MYTLVIGKNRSKNFEKAIDIAFQLGGSFDGDKITPSINEDMKAYETFFPLFKLNVLSWVQLGSTIVVIKSDYIGPCFWKIKERRFMLKFWSNWSLK